MSFFYIVSKKMMSNIYMVGALMMIWVLSNVHNTFIITHDRNETKVYIIIFQPLFNL